MSLSSSDFVLSWLVAIFEKRATRCRLLLVGSDGNSGHQPFQPIFPRWNPVLS